MLKIGINGFGRIGRMVMRAALKQDKVKVVAVNDLSDSSALAHLLKYDSIYGILDADVKSDEKGFLVDGERVVYFSEKEPAKIPWKDAGVDLVIESTGIFTKRDAAAAHLEAGARKVIISAPAAVDAVLVLGVNEHAYDPDQHFVISNASCTTNALAPLVKVLHENFGVKKGLMNTTHAYTNDQNLHDFPHKDPRRARAAALSLIPTTTGAAKTVGEVIPELKGRIDGFAIRVPIPTVSLVDFVTVLEKQVTVDSINDAFKTAAEGSPYLDYSDEPLVSVDYKGNSNSVTVDGQSTMVVSDTMARVVGWYDNEWGYSCRLIDLAAIIGERG
ncbi:MAG: type I glyceraldehyde-3-phosphate dehydrogenase [Bacillota bacterium]